MTTSTKTPVIDATVSTAGGFATHLTLKFSNGQTLSLAQSDLSPEIVSIALMHGLKQKLVDAAAISRNTDTGRAASVEDKFNAVKEVYDRLLSGEWNKRREGGAGGASGGLLFSALCRMYEGKKTPADVREFLEGLTDAEKAKLRTKNPKVVAMIETIRAERAAKDGEGDGAADTDLLAGLEG